MTWNGLRNLISYVPKCWNNSSVYRQLEIGGSEAEPAMSTPNQAEPGTPIQLYYSTDIYRSRSPVFDRLSKFKQFNSMLRTISLLYSSDSNSQDDSHPSLGAYYSSQIYSTDHLVAQKDVQSSVG